MPQAEKAHFDLSHFCAGCNVAVKFHTGCVVEGNVVIDKSWLKAQNKNSSLTTSQNQSNLDSGLVSGPIFLA